MEVLTTLSTEEPSHSIALVATAICCLSLAAAYNALREPYRNASFWASQPWFNGGKGAFSWIRATLRSISDCEAMVAEGYRKVFMSS